jgi:2-polyprenyl-3-methyl-5-hydroxy-6-metoxy-1,4-benzoquinol methylase
MLNTTNLKWYGANGYKNIHSGDLNNHAPDQDIIGYLTNMYDRLSIVRDKSVLEIGPYLGSHTQLITQHEPKSLTLVEASTTATIHLIKEYPQYVVVNNDIFNFLQNKNHFEIVVCAGVLYHFHSPLYLLEMIANNCDPDYVIIESVMGSRLTINEEKDNTDGQRYTLGGWKSAKISIRFYPEIIKQAMNNLGYRLIDTDSNISRFNLVSKHNAHLFVFQKI